MKKHGGADIPSMLEAYLDQRDYTVENETWISGVEDCVKRLDTEEVFWLRDEAFVLSDPDQPPRVLGTDDFDWKKITTLYLVIGICQCELEGRVTAEANFGLRRSVEYSKGPSGK